MYAAGVIIAIFGLGVISYAWLDYSATKVSPWPMIGIGAAIVWVGVTMIGLSYA